MSFLPPVHVSARREGQLVRILQGAMVAILVIGLWQGTLVSP